VLVVPYFLVLIFSGVYRTYWLRAGLERYYFLSKLLLLSAIISFILLNILGKKHWVFDGIPTRSMFTLFMLQTTISWSLILGERFILRYFEAFALRSYYLKNTPEAKLHSTVIYGGGLGCRIYLTSLYTGRHLSCPFRILGIVDDDLSLRKLNVYGFRVLGTSHDLEAIYKRKPFETMVMTTLNMTDEAVENVRAFAKAHDVKLTMFVAQEYPANLEFFKTLQEKAIHPNVAKDNAGQDKPESAS
jgi:FlaA1/EpsC-like NDP-sugar epimerase